MKKRFVMILALLVAYVAVFAAAGCTDADKNAEVSFSENYFVTYSDRSGRILIAARYGDEFYVKRSEALPNTYTEKDYYPVDGGWQVYIKNGERWNSYGTEDSLDDALADILGPVVEGMKSINSGSAEKTGKTSAELASGNFKGKNASEYLEKSTGNTYWVLDAYGIIYLTYSESDSFTLAEYYPLLDEQTFRAYCIPDREELIDN